jgi:hypothetical protein
MSILISLGFNGHVGCTRRREKYYSDAREAGWIEGQDGTHVSGVPPIIGEVLMAWSAHFVTNVGQVHLIEFPVHMAVETMHEAVECDVVSV